MRVAWAKTIDEREGNAYGFSVASRGYRAALRMAGIEEDPSADIVLHWTQASTYAPVPGKKNILGTVCESLNLAPSFLHAFAHSDTTAIFTPSTFCQHTFRKFTNKPVFVCGHGADSKTFTYRRRWWTPALSRKIPFTFLYVGARNPRKGVDFLEEWWREMGMFQYSGVRLVLKMTLGEQERRVIGEEMMACGMTPVHQDADGGMILREGNMEIDTRNLPQAWLADLYHRAHCFVFPSRGEGFGLTLAEAMATGLPCIATRFGGYLDFCNEDSAFLFGFKPGPLMGTDGGTFIGALPDPKEFCEQVRAVMEDYPAAIRRGARAAGLVRRLCQWLRVGQQLRAVCAAVANESPLRIAV